MTSRVDWTDVAPRDGLQNIADTVLTEAKVRLVRGLLATGVARVEATAFVSAKWVPQLSDAAEVLAAIDPADMARIRVLVPNWKGVEMALEHGVTSVLLTIGATDSFNMRNVNRTVAASLDELSNIIERAGERCAVDVALSVAFGCPFEGSVDPRVVMELCAEIARRGAADVGIADTIGVATPAHVRDLCTQVATAVPVERVSLHVHDTRGAGVANVLAAYACGIRRFDGSAGGVGGCPFAPRSTGNVCSEDALSALRAEGATIDVDLDAYCRVSEGLAHDLGHDLPGKLYRAGIWNGDAVAAAGGRDDRRGAGAGTDDGVNAGTNTGTNSG